MADYIIQKAIDRKDMSGKAKKAMDGRAYDLQPKYDGCHMVVKFLATGVECVSATGEPVRSCEHIVAALQAVFDVRPGDNLAFCGEVWIPNTPFPEISGAFRRHTPQPQLKFAPFDVVQINAAGQLCDGTGYGMRIRPLQTMPKHPAIVPFHNSPFVNEPMAESYASYLKGLGGYDGAVMHDLHAPYKPGRCRDGEVIKVKPLVEVDVEVVGVKLDKGEKTGKNTAALEVRLPAGTGFVSTGLTQAQVDEIHRTPSAWVGQVVAVEAMGWTEDGKLREPRFKGLRHDKARPDY